MKKELISLKNGIDCLFIPHVEVSTAGVQVWFRAGSVLEEGPDRGIAHFLEHMFFKGTKKRPGTALVSEVESFGGEINAFTSFDYTCYYINSPGLHLAQSIDILLDMVSGPTFKEDELRPERGVVFEESRRSIDRPDQFAFHKLQEAAFTGGYAHPILGVERTIKNFSREQLIRFRRRFYNRRNMFLVIYGDIEKKRDKLKKAIESFRFPDGPESRFPPFRLKRRPSVSVHQKETAMASLSFAIQSTAISEVKAPAEELAINCLGHGETSPLYKELVASSSLANSTSAGVMFMPEGGVHLIKIVFPFSSLGPVLQKTKNILQNLFRDGFSKKDVNKIKNQYTASKIFDLESLESYTFAVGHSYAQLKNPDGDREFIDKIEKIDHSLANEAFHDIFQRPIHLSLQIPKDSPLKEAKGKLLSLQRDMAKILSPKKKKAVHKRAINSRYDTQLKLILLKRGIKLLYRKNTLCPTFVLTAHLRGGQTEEVKENAGIHHFISSMLTRGHRTASYEELKDGLEEKSASFSGFSGKNVYGIKMHGLTRHFQELTEHFFESLSFPRFDRKVFRTKKDLILRKIASEKEDPLKICFKDASRLFFHGHPYSLPPIGEENSIRPLLKKELMVTHGHALSKKDILLTYCGDIDLDTVLSTVEGHLKNLSPRTDRKRKEKKMRQIVTTSFISFDREQTHLFMGIKTAPSHSLENIYLKFLTAYLSGQSSPLFVEVRDRQGLCYSVSPIEHLGLEGGYWGIYIAAGHDKAERALEAISKIIDDIRRKAVTKKEFETIKIMIEGQNLINIQTNEDYANVHSLSIVGGYGLDYFHKRNELIKNLNYSDFKKAIMKILGRKWSASIVGRKALKLES